jgi:hypothetical protein
MQFWVQFFKMKFQFQLYNKFQKSDLVKVGFYAHPNLVRHW